MIKIKRNVKDQAERKERREKKAEERRKKKAIKKRRVQRFGHRENKGHSKNGKKACLIGGLDAGVLCLLLTISLVNHGRTASIIGVFGVMCWIVSVVGFRSALQGFHERDKNYITCKIGLGLNLAIILFLLLIFLWGLF